MTVLRLPAPERTDLAAADRPAPIGPLDTIEVEVFGLPDFNREIQVDASGRIAMPLAGTIDARGKTPKNSRARSRRHYGEITSALLRLSSTSRVR